MPERFPSKVIAIEENKDLENMKNEELVGSLQTYENTYSQQRKNKSIALNTVRKGHTESYNDFAMSDKEITFYARKFKNMIISRMNKKRFDKFKK